ncbi:MAG: DciA family protein [Methylococcaceae bacterium]|nr:DciA family protein [Methylococcaceae bacterium]
MLKIIRQNLSETFAELVVCCVVKPTELIILTESAALASQLRFHGPDILDALNANSLTGIKSLRFRVLQTNKTEAPRRIARRPPSLQSIETLRDYSLSFSDTGLRHSLNRLADTLEKQHLSKERDRTKIVANNSDRK